MIQSAPNETAPAVFLDRDGTLMKEVNYCGDPKKVEVFTDVPDALALLKSRGYKLIVVTNQSGIGRGYFGVEQYEAVNGELGRQIGPGVIDASYFCPDAPDIPSQRRKPSAAMVFEAQRDHKLDLRRSYFIGDKAIDIECGRNAGVRTILVQTGYGSGERAAVADFDAADFTAAANWILSQPA